MPSRLRLCCWSALESPEFDSRVTECLSSPSITHSHHHTHRLKCASRRHLYHRQVSIAAARLRWKADLALAVYSDTPPTPPSFWEDALADLDNGAASGGPEGAVPCRMPPHASQRHAMV